MILFMVEKPEDTKAKSQYYVPFISGFNFTKDNFWLVSWNEICVSDEQLRTVNIEKVADLKRVVFVAARRDKICLDINRQFQQMFHVDILGETSTQLVKEITELVFSSWLHPMIGNLTQGLGIRPQTSEQQYIKNWESFPDTYMCDKTKETIHTMLLNPGSVGLSVLTKSGRDQLRVCRDITELARAVMGEISTYATKKLEKIFALDLCQSDNLLEAQKTLLAQTLAVMAKTQEQQDNLASKINNVQYIRFYFPNVFQEEHDDNVRWALFVDLMSVVIGDKNPLKHKQIEDDKQNMITCCIEQFQKYPPVIRSAIMINDLWCLEKDRQETKHSLASSKVLGGASELPYVVDCEIVDSASASFLPAVEKVGRAGGTERIHITSCTRDENHVTTITYRHFLLPLWAGPSGHLSGSLKFYYKHLQKETGFRIPSGQYISLASVLIGSMFPFWRLYYDKRISAVHTLTETIEGAYFLFVDTSAPYNGIHERIVYESKLIEQPVDNYNDAFELLTHDKPGQSSTINIGGLIHPARVMWQLKEMYIPQKASPKENFEKLDQEITNKKQMLAQKGYEIPEWSKPIFQDDKQKMDNYNKAFAGVTIRDFTILNVRVFKTEPELPKSRRIRSSSLERLYKRISASKCYNFSEDFLFLPCWLIGNEEKPLLKELTFYDIQSCSWDGIRIYFTADVDTQSEIWDGVRGYLPLENRRQTVSCTVTDGEEGLTATVSMPVSGQWKLGCGLTVSFSQAVITSGLDEATGIPSCYLWGEIAAGNDRIALAVSFRNGTMPVAVYGNYEDGKVLTISRLLALFGLEQMFSASALLPDDEGVFGSLGLREMWMTVLPESEYVTRIAFTITAQNPWQLWKDKITLQPYFEIVLAYPFDGERRSVYFDVLGKWYLGNTEFDLVYRSYGDIQLRLAENAVLDFSQVAALFAKDVTFPPVQLTGMEMTADPVSGNYSLYLSAEDLLHFTAGKVELAIQGVSLQLDFLNGSFGDMVLTGSFQLAALELVVSGSYHQDGSWSFEAFVYHDTDYCLGDFIQAAVEQLGGGAVELPEEFLSVNLRMAGVSYQSGNHALMGYITLEKVLQISDSFAIESFSLQIGLADDMPLSCKIMAELRLCGTEIQMVLEKEGEDFCIWGTADFSGITFGDVACELGLDSRQIPDFIAQLAIPKVGLGYDFSSRTFTVSVITESGEISLRISAKDPVEWEIRLKTGSRCLVDLSEIPVAGEMAHKAMPQAADLSIGEFMIIWRSKSGASVECRALGEIYHVDLGGEPNLQQKRIPFTDRTLGMETLDHAWVKWVMMNKTVSILQIPKLGIGLDGSRILLLLDVNLLASPFTFGMTGAGVGVHLTDPADIAYYLSGFSLSFENQALSVGGSFALTVKEGKRCYAGALLLRTKAFSAEAIAEYGDGALMAYCTVSGGMIGPPVFNVRGVALGFGYHKQLALPDVRHVAEYPLITAAAGGFSPQILSDFDRYITDRSGQYFLTAGVRFNSFGMINGFLLMSVSFGNDLEIGLLGLADVSIPSGVPANPIARAQLAIKADYSSARGEFCAEARLTSESYILCHDCKLSGGFAAYCWFDESAHSGDFVVTLGGYHPSFNKPEHYPVVPRLGFNWNVMKSLNISGEAYFALTPSAVMAGGRLSAVYTLGKLKAWFIAYADFLISWRPFAYRAEIGVSLGASYRLDLWLIHKTFSIEMAAQLSLWGPEIHGKLHISWFIISFTISFSAGPDRSENMLDWATFKEGFLHEPAAYRNAADQQDAVLTIGMEGIIGKTVDGIDIVNPGELVVMLSSQVPESGNVRPVNSTPLQTELELHIETSDHINVDNRFVSRKLTKNLPAALWKSTPADPLKEDPLVTDAVCGVELRIKGTEQPELFPKLRPISLEELYRNNTLDFLKCFSFEAAEEVVLSDKNTVQRFSEQVMSADTCRRRKEFLQKYGIDEETELNQFAEDADSWLTEDILFANENQ